MVKRMAKARKPMKTKKSVKSKPKASALRKLMKEKLIQRIKEDQERRESSGRGIFKSGTGVTFWKPESGDHIVDIIPYSAGPSHPTVPEGEPAYNLRVRVHYGVGPGEDKSFLCVQETFREPCPICEHRLQLKNEGAEDDVWKSLLPKKRAVYNIICWDSTREEEKGVQIWEVAEFYFQKHLDTLSKPPRRPGRNQEIVAFADIDEGKSISFTINPPKSRNDFKEFIGHTFVDRDYVIDDDQLESAHCLDQIIHIPTYKEVYEEYWGESLEEEGEYTEEEPESEPEEEPEEDYTEEEPEGEPEEEYTEEEDGTEEGSDDDNACPAGGDFGVDTSELDECEECDIWQECLQEQQAKLRKRRNKKTTTEKKRVRGATRKLKRRK